MNLTPIPRRLDRDPELTDRGGDSLPVSAVLLLPRLKTVSGQPAASVSEPRSGDCEGRYFHSL